MTNRSFPKDASLLTGVDTAHPTVKTYVLYPQLGAIEGYGAGKIERNELVSAIRLRRWDRQDCLYLLLKQMSVNYIGTTQNIDDRVTTHATRRNAKNGYDWDRIIAFCSVRDILNTNIAKYAEYTLYILLKSKGCVLLQSPPDARHDRFLNPQDQLTAKQVVQEIERIIDLLDTSLPEIRAVSGSNPLRSDEVLDSTLVTELPPQLPTKSDEQDWQDAEEDMTDLRALSQSGQEGIEVEISAYGAYARGRYTPYGLEVYAGSIGTTIVQPHFRNNRSYARIRGELQQQAVITVDGERLIFVQPYTFASPTAAAQLLCGASVPGPLRWKRISDGLPLRDITNQ